MKRKVPGWLAAIAIAITLAAVMRMGYRTINNDPGLRPGSPFEAGSGGKAKPGRGGSPRLDVP